jgi:hypothetical protein
MNSKKIIEKLYSIAVKQQQQIVKLAEFISTAEEMGDTTSATIEARATTNTILDSLGNQAMDKFYKAGDANGARIGGYVMLNAKKSGSNWAVTVQLGNTPPTSDNPNTKQAFANIVKNLESKINATLSAAFTKKASMFDPAATQITNAKVLVNEM